MFDSINRVETAKRLEELLLEIDEANHNNGSSQADNHSQEINIKIIGPSEYKFYAEILAEIAEEEYIRYDKVSEELSLTADFFYAISKKIERGDVLALFIASDYKGEAAGANIICKERYLEGAGLEAITGYDVVRNEYRRKNIGIALRKAGFKWMVDNSHYICMAIIPKDNLQKVCMESGFSMRNVSKDKEGDEQYYRIDLSGPGKSFQISSCMEFRNAR